MAGARRLGRGAGTGHDLRGAAPERRRRSGDIILTCDHDLYCDGATAATMPLLGYLPEALVGRNVGDLVHPEDFARLAGYAEDATHHTASLPVRLWHHEGGWIPLVASRHRETGLDFAPRDIAERIRMEEWIATQRQLADTILAKASDAIVSIDRAGVIVEWNGGAEALFGWTRAEAVGREVTFIVPPSLRSEYRGALSELWSNGSGRVDEPTEILLLRRDGAEIWAEVTGWTVQVGQTWRFNAMMRDVSGRKEVERVLTEAREHSEEVSRLKSEFLATMSHEIRTPMNGVIGLADILCATELDPTQRRYAEGIRSAGTALLGVINDVLDFSKAEAGMIVLDDVRFDLAELIEDVIDIVAGPAREKGLELVGHTRPDVPTVLRGDPGRLRQIMLNLCGNAVKFTQRGEVVVTARRAVEQPEGDGRVRLRIEVADTGIGLRPQDRDRMFEAFSQADASTTRRFGGTGLGLAISRRLVGAMGGHIGVDSEPGHGSTFWFEIELPEDEQRAARQPRPADLHGLRVLVVDDNATNRFVLETQLTQWNLAPTTVASGEAALAILRAPETRLRPYDLAVLDMAMPNMDGLQLARRISSDPTLAGMHMILLTSGADIAPDRLREVGIAARLTKPVHRSDLFDGLARILSPDDAPAPEPAPRAIDEAAEGARGRVLLAEDNDINQLVAVGLLSRLGFRTDIAETGAVALELALRREYDAILMDCQMPEMDGYAATRELRVQEGGRRHTPVIALTAGARTEDREQCLAAGMDDFVTKPIDVHELTAALDRWVTADAAARESAVDSHTDDPDPAPPSASAPVSVEAQVGERLDRLSGGDPEGVLLVRRLVASFLEGTPAELEQLTSAVAVGDHPAMASRAHRLRGSAANLGAVRLAERLGAVEEAGRSTDDYDESELLRQVTDEYGAARAALQRRLDDPGNGGGA